MTAPLPLEEAQHKLLADAAPLASETIATEAAVGRWLAAPLVSRRIQPWADLSAMDGFATAGAGPWRVIGESAAGHPFGARLGRGEATRISTGAAMPEGADAVLILEDALMAGETLAAPVDLPSPRHIRRKGFDFAIGDALLAPGTRIGPAQLALAIAAGVGEVEVGRLPRVAVLDTGDELANGPDDDRSDRLPASNGPMIAAMCAGLASKVERIGPVPDNATALLAALERAAEADVIVTSGGASVGEHDLIRPVLERWGAEIDFWRVAIRPGKPLLVGRRGAQWILGLPGNPASAFVTCFLFVLPLLRRLGGAPQSAALPRSLPARLEGTVPATGRRREFVRGVLSGGSVVPIAERDSSALRALASANCLIERTAGSPSLNGPADVIVFQLDA